MFLRVKDEFIDYYLWDINYQGFIFEEEKGERVFLCKIHIKVVHVPFEIEKLVPRNEVFLLRIFFDWRLKIEGLNDRRKKNERKTCRWRSRREFN